ncbi:MULTISPECIES: winged helix DNA-binding protein [Shewanella]|jgi:predicted MarR family transcription regulator|uniref:Transcriptional regulator n=1 Tax=Shewanella ulleungensis TaxID=2282699 RepID=A0ABQ2QXC9_9GAMM|nr:MULTISPECIES: winged helix DNA-binding protein [Shewanella]MCL1114311.1 winged helix DNA-binding protein [Shewanella basaltis]MCL1151922.1 winged helix DNA-binding protein [Shewanella ulleungensis]GGP97983.1 transcriptional regulator [Shewanella ulleungensis]
MTSELNEKRKIVSSKHLANSEAWPLSEVELGLTVFYNAFTKWIVRCAAAAGCHDLSPVDVLTLHNIHYRDNIQRRIDICFMLNIEDTHTVNYSLKKLVKLSLITGTKRGKEMYYATTEQGNALCEEYRLIREECLISSMSGLKQNAEELSQMASVLRSLSGIYDQAARAAATL